MNPFKRLVVTGYLSVLAFVVRMIESVGRLAIAVLNVTADVAKEKLELVFQSLRVTGAGSPSKPAKDQSVRRSAAGHVSMLAGLGASGDHQLNFPLRTSFC